MFLYIQKYFKSDLDSCSIDVNQQKLIYLSRTCIKDIFTLFKDLRIPWKILCITQSRAIRIL